MTDGEFSDEEIAAFLAEHTKFLASGHGDIYIPPTGGANSKSESEALWARVHDTERRLTAVESRVSWLLALVFALAVALGATELTLSITSLSSQ